MEARILLVADFANVDALGKLNIIGAFNRIFVREFPAKHALLYVVIRLAVELGEFGKERNLSIILYDEDSGERWKSGELKFSVAPPEGGHSVDFHPIVAIQNLEFEKPGRYEFRVFVNDDLKGTIPLDVAKLEHIMG
jgi:Family of unknown function (DUF6941)